MAFLNHPLLSAVNPADGQGMGKNFYDRVYEIVASIPQGSVMSYGQVASWAGNVRASRAAGYAMLRCTRKSIPCHRVVYRNGELADGLAFGGEGRQRAMLEAEDVTFTPDGRVDMKKHRHRGPQTCPGS